MIHTCQHCQKVFQADAPQEGQNLFCPDCGKPQGVSATSGPPAPNGGTILPLAQLNKFFFWWWLSLVLAIPTCGLATIVSAVFAFILLYRYWQLIPSREDLPTPGKAVGYCFIPFFNIYWMFVAFGKLGKELNTQISQKIKMLDILPTAYCLMSLVLFAFAIGINALNFSFPRQVAENAGPSVTLIALMAVYWLLIILMQVLYIMLYVFLQRGARQWYADRSIEK